MNQNRPPEVLREEATRWWVRLDSGEVNDAEREDFEAWRTQSPDHRAAFAEICAIWGQLEGLRPRFAFSPSAYRAAPPRTRARMLWATAASLILALIAIPLFISTPPIRERDRRNPDHRARRRFHRLPEQR
jgi:transmembrane sensor